MKKTVISILITISLVITMIGTLAEIDYSGMTLDELMEAQEQLTAAIEAAQKAAENADTQKKQAPTLDASNYTEMTKGAKGDEVKALQSRLKDLGFYSSTIDGDYGNGTVNAIKAFEDYNGLEQTGVASSELQAFLYSENAKGIEIPDIEITSIGLQKRYGWNYARPTFVNHTDYTIDGLTYRLKGYNTYGERIMSDTLTVNDIVRYEGNDDYKLEHSTGEITGIKIKAGGKYQLVKSNEISLSMFERNAMTVVYITVIRYHRDDGTMVEIPENDQIWYGSDGKVVTIEYENKKDEPQTLTAEIEDNAENIELGLSVKYIDNFFAEVAGLPMGGLYVYNFDNKSPAAEAGIKEGDVIVKIGDVWTYDEDSYTLAKGLMNATESSTVYFYRKGELREAEIATF